MINRDNVQNKYLMHIKVTKQYQSIDAKCHPFVIEGNDRL